MAAKQSKLSALHEALADQMIFELNWYREEGIPVPAADKAAISKFLKDNSISCDPADADDLKALQDAFAASSKERREKAKAAMSLSEEEIRATYGANH